VLQLVRHDLAASQIHDLHVGCPPRVRHAASAPRPRGDAHPPDLRAHVPRGDLETADSEEAGKVIVDRGTGWYTGIDVDAARPRQQAALGREIHCVGDAEEEPDLPQVPRPLAALSVRYREVGSPRHVQSLGRRVEADVLGPERHHQVGGDVVVEDLGRVPDVAEDRPLGRVERRVRR